MSNNTLYTMCTQTSELLRKRHSENIAHNYLRVAILTWKIPSGNPNLEQGISDQLGISRTPVRVALKLLEAEEWLKSTLNATRSFQS